MTRRIDWRRAATKADMAALRVIDEQIGSHDLHASNYRKSRKRLISKLYARARRAAKGGK